MGQPIGLITNGRDAADRIRRRDEIAGEHGRIADQSRGHPSDGRDARGRRPAPSADCPGGRGPESFTRIRETLARVELSDGLTFDRLLIEAEPRLPRDATVVAVLGERHARDGRGAGPPQAPGIRRQRGAAGFRRGRADRLGRAALARAFPFARCPMRRSCTASASSSS